MARPRKPFGAMLGERARARRIALGMSQQAVAQQLGISPQELNRLERGHRPRGPAPETIAKLADVLSLPASDLLTA